MYQVVPYTSFLFEAAALGDLETLRKAFATGKFSPYVLSDRDGDSLLHVGCSPHTLVKVIDADDVE